MSIDISRHMGGGNITEDRFGSKNLVIFERNSQQYLWQYSLFFCNYLLQLLGPITFKFQIVGQYTWLICVDYQRKRLELHSL
jgi:hypothetical protein